MATKTEKRPHNRVIDTSVVFERGRRDRERGVSRTGVHYADPRMVEAWERGWDEKDKEERRAE